MRGAAGRARMHAHPIPERPARELHSASQATDCNKLASTPTQQKRTEAAACECWAVSGAQRLQPVSDRRCVRVSSVALQWQPAWRGCCYASMNRTTAFARELAAVGAEVLTGLWAGTVCPAVQPPCDCAPSFATSAPCDRLRATARQQAYPAQQDVSLGGFLGAPFLWLS
jgi:hypothetical protein